MERFPSISPTNRPKENLYALIRTGAAEHGSGLKTLTPEQHADISALLSRLGWELESPILADLPAETLKDIHEYAVSKDTSRRSELALRVKEQFSAIAEAGYKSAA